MRAEDITGGITADGYDAPRARFDDQVCFDFMKGRCTRGASCRYSHDPNASGWDPNFGRRGRSPSPRRRYDSRDRYDDRRRSPPRRCAAASLHMLSWPNGQGVSLLRRRLRVRVPPRAARRHESVAARRHEYVTAHRTQVQVFDEKRGKMRAEDITGGITADGYDAPRARFDDQVCFDFMKGRCTRGASCRYSHDPNASGWDPNFGRRGRSPSPRRRYDSRDRYDDRRRSPPRRCAAVSVLIALVA